MGSTSRLPMSRCRTLVVLLFCCGVAIRVAPQTTSKPRFKAAVNLVRVTVIARDAYGKAIRNLGASDFLVTDDSRTQSIDSLVRVERGKKKGEPRRSDPAKIADSIEGGPRYSEAGSSGYLIVAFDSMGGQFREDSEISPFVRREGSCNRAIYGITGLPYWDLAAWSRISLKIGLSCCGPLIRSQGACPIRPLPA
jgi:hypothetical protein